MTGPNLAEREEQQPVPEPAASLAELAAAFSQGLDAAEGREPGHAVKVAYVAMLLAREVPCGEEAQRATFYAALLHDVGVPAAASFLTSVPELDEELIFGFAPLSDFDAAEVPREHRALAEQAVHAHVSAAADFLTQPWFPEATQPAVRASHENWDGEGYPAGLAGDEIPIVGRILRAADLFECVVSGESNPLSARARAAATIGEWVGRELQTEIAEALGRISSDDAFWLGFYDSEVAQGLIDAAPVSGVPASGKLLWSFSRAVAELVDAKAGHPGGRAERLMHYVEAMTAALGMSEAHGEMLKLAALWNDVGALGVPNRILVKPDLLSLDEMQRMRTHPTFSGEIMGRIGALAEAARWVAAHHERLDGKGYPEMLTGVAIPTEAGVLSLADAYVAMTSRRPYREALSGKDAQAVLEAGAGTQWDPFLVRVLLDVLDTQAAPAAATEAAG